MSYRRYAADCLRMLTESNAKFAGGPYMSGKWNDGSKKSPADNRSPEEITLDIVKRGGLVVRKTAEVKGGELDA